MNVLAVGGAGSIGSHCVRLLARAGHRPMVLDNLVFGHRAPVAKVEYPGIEPIVAGAWQWHRTHPVGQGDTKNHGK